MKRGFVSMLFNHFNRRNIVKMLGLGTIAVSNGKLFSTVAVAAEKNDSGDGML